MADGNTTPADALHPLERAPSIIPPGLTLNDIRRSLSPSQQMIVRFTLSGHPSGTSFGTEQHGRWFTDCPYIVGVNNSNDSVFLNPLDQDSWPDIPEESNMPGHFDDHFSEAETREKYGLELTVETPDANVKQVILSAAADKSNLSIFHEGLDTMEAKIPEIIDTAIISLGLDHIGKTEHYLTALRYAIVHNLARKHFLTQRKQGSEISVEEAVTFTATEFLQRVGKLIKSRPQQLKNTGVTDTDFAFSLDTISLDPQNPNEGIPVLIHYSPIMNWRCALPLGGCPAQAAAALQGYLQSESPQNNSSFPNFTDSVTRLTSEGKLTIDSANNSFLFTNVGPLVPRAVFHGDDTVQEAVDTLRPALLPLDLFNQQIFHDTTFQKSSEVIEITI